VPTKRTGPIWVAAALLLSHGVLLVLVAGLALASAMRGIDPTKVHVTPEDLGFFLRPPVFPWVLSPLAIASSAAAWLCSDLRGLRFVLGTSGAWLAFMLWAAANGLTPTFLIEPVVILGCLISGRQAFAREK
jgi:hypothetical protein